MSKHTPGPWYIGKDFWDQGRHIYAEQMVRDDEGEEWHPLIAVTDDDERMVDYQANARLIAAAPTLLQFLAAMFDAYENGTPCYTDPEDCSGYLGNAFKLSNEDFHAIAELLNTLDPRDTTTPTGESK